MVGEELHSDLVPWTGERHGKPFLDHPLAFGFIDRPDKVEALNEVYTYMCEARAKAASDGDWERYVFCHAKPHRFNAMTDAVANGADVPTLVRKVWIDSENIWQDQDAWREYLPPAGSWHERLMDAEERSALADLPDPVPVFRGYARDGREHGLSWTTDPEVAGKFAHRSAALDGSTLPCVAAGTLTKNEVIAYFLAEHESEVVALPENVTIIRIDPL
jgi:hypothetical protein